MEKKRSERLLSPWLISAFIAFVAVMVSLYAFWSELWPYSLSIPSPTKEYYLEQRYTDFLTPGYRGKTYLVYQNQCWFIEDIGPGYAGWLSDTEFFVGDRHLESHSDTYSVFDFIYES